MTSSVLDACIEKRERDLTFFSRHVGIRVACAAAAMRWLDLSFSLVRRTRGRKRPRVVLPYHASLSTHRVCATSTEGVLHETTPLFPWVELATPKKQVPSLQAQLSLEMESGSLTHAIRLFLRASRERRQTLSPDFVLLWWHHVMHSLRSSKESGGWPLNVKRQMLAFLLDESVYWRRCAPAAALAQMLFVHTALARDLGFLQDPQTIQTTVDMIHHLATSHKAQPYSLLFALTTFSTTQAFSQLLPLVLSAITSSVSSASPHYAKTITTLMHIVRQHGGSPVHFEALADFLHHQSYLTRPKMVVLAVQLDALRHTAKPKEEQVTRCLADMAAAPVDSGLSACLTALLRWPQDRKAIALLDRLLRQHVQCLVVTDELKALLAQWWPLAAQKDRFIVQPLWFYLADHRPSWLNLTSITWQCGQLLRQRQFSRVVELVRRPSFLPPPSAETVALWHMILRALLQDNQTALALELYRILAEGCPPHDMPALTDFFQSTQRLFPVLSSPEVTKALRHAASRSRWLLQQRKHNQQLIAKRLPYYETLLYSLVQRGDLRQAAKIAEFLLSSTTEEAQENALSFPSQQWMGFFIKHAFQKEKYSLLRQAETWLKRHPRLQSARLSNMLASGYTRLGRWTDTKRVLQSFQHPDQGDLASLRWQMEQAKLDGKRLTFEALGDRYVALCRAWVTAGHHLDEVVAVWEGSLEGRMVLEHVQEDIKTSHRRYGTKQVWFPPYAWCLPQPPTCRLSKAPPNLWSDGMGMPLYTLLLKYYALTEDWARLQRVVGLLRARQWQSKQMAWWPRDLIQASLRQWQSSVPPSADPLKLPT